MTQKQINTLKAMLKDENVQGKKFLEKVLWLNTTKPKFKVGDCFKVTDRGHRVYGYPVKDFAAKITEIRMDTYLLEVVYVLESHVKCGNRELDATIVKTENELKSCKKYKDNMNILGDVKEEAVESLDVRL